MKNIFVLTFILNMPLFLHGCQESKELQKVWVTPITGSYKLVDSPYYITNNIRFDIEADLVGGSRKAQCKTMKYNNITTQLNENQKPYIDELDWGPPHIQLLPNYHTETPIISMQQFVTTETTTTTMQKSIQNEDGSTTNLEPIKIKSDKHNFRNNLFLLNDSSELKFFSSSPACYGPNGQTVYTVKNKNQIFKDGSKTPLVSMSNDENDIVTLQFIQNNFQEYFLITAENNPRNCFERGIYLYRLDSNNNTVTDNNLVKLPENIKNIYSVQLSPDADIICIQDRYNYKYTSHIGALDRENRMVTHLQKIKTTKKAQTLFFDDNNNLHTITKDTLNIPLLSWLPTTFLIRYFDVQISNGLTLLKPVFFTINKIFTCINVACLSFIAYKAATYFGADLLSQYT